MTQQIDKPLAAACPALMNSLQILQPEDVDSTLGRIKATMPVLAS